LFRVLRAGVLTVALCGYCNSTLLAEEHAPASDAAHAGKAHESPNILSGDLGNVFWTLAIFGFLLITLRLIFWKPLLELLHTRERFLHESLETAKRERAESERLLADYTKRVNQAREEATAIVEEGRRDAEEVRKRIHAEAKGEADAIVAAAKKDIQIARDDAVKRLHDETINLATSLASKIVRKDMSAGDHRRLLDESLSELSKARN
jgi:F-type H+-transporting ATPase subunit b